MVTYSFNNHLKSYWLAWNWGEQNLEAQRRSSAKHSTGFWGTNFAVVPSDGTWWVATYLYAGRNWSLNSTSGATCHALMGQYCQEWQARWKRKVLGFFLIFYLSPLQITPWGRANQEAKWHKEIYKVLLPISQSNKQKSEYGSKR